MMVRKTAKALLVGVAIFTGFASSAYAYTCAPGENSFLGEYYYTSGGCEVRMTLSCENGQKKLSQARFCNLVPQGGPQ